MFNKKNVANDGSIDTKENIKKYSPQLLWPKFGFRGDGFYEDDEDVFSGNNDTVKKQKNDFYKIQREQCISPGSRAFWNCFRMCKDIVLVDKFFDNNAYRRMLLELNSSYKSRDIIRKRIQIFCSDRFDDVRDIHEKSINENPDVLGYHTVIINLLEMRNATHDRFAIMDKEIWHCGAAVGGMHGYLSALSHGWKDENDCLKRYFCGEESKDDI
ncbi:MAG: hypothetical protein IKN43_05970 [Selenomonadaceae bacterium]|nr:hypothetical protein [Selenomonadaceae bacterium]